MPWAGYLCPHLSGSYTEVLAPSSMVNGIGALIHKTPDFPCGSAGRESACNGGDLGSIPGLGRSPREGKGYPLQYSRASLVAQLVKNLPEMQEILVQFLGREDPLEKGKATHSSILGLPLWLSW